MNSGVREIKVIKATKGLDAERKIRMAAYCRVSSDSEDQANSFMAQMRYYNDYIKSRDDMVLVDIYADEGITGTSTNKRKEFKRMINDCQKRKIDRILVKSVSRFARNSLECIENVRILAECGVSVYFENDHIDTQNMNSEMILYIKSAFAQGEAVSASKRMSTSVRMRMEDGTFVGTPAPYGYRLVEKELVVYPGEAEIVRKIFDMYLSGKGMNLIVEELNSNNSGLKWTVSHIRYILTNEKYKGDTLMQKKFTPEVLPFHQKKNRGERPQFYAEDTHEAIVSEEIFNAVQKMHKEKEEKYFRPTEDKKYFFSEKIKCRKCGWMFRRIVNNNKVYWVCRKKGLADVKCDCRSYSEKEVFCAFISMYNTFRQNESVLLDETIDQLQFLKTKITMTNTQISSIDCEIASLSEQNNIYNKLYSKGIIDEISFYEKTDKIKNSLSELRLQRTKIICDNDGEYSIDELKSLKRNLKDYPKSLSEIDGEIFSAIIKMIYAEQDGTLTFVLQGDLKFNVEVK